VTLLPILEASRRTSSAIAGLSNTLLGNIVRHLLLPH
jgi:hypothetical protein